MKLSKNIRTNIVLLRDGGEIFVTYDQFKALEERKFNGRATELVEIRDIDSNEQMYYGELSGIKGFKEIRVKDTSGIKYVCEFGIRHSMEDKCTCTHDFGIDGLTFSLRMGSLFPSVYYPADLTEQQRMEIIKSK